MTYGSYVRMMSLTTQQQLPAGTNHSEVVDRRPDAESTETVLPDLRGQGGLTQHGRPVRPYKGSTRPPHVDPVVWELVYSKKDKQQCIKEYLESLRVSGVPVEPERASASSSASPAMPATAASTSKGGPRKSHFETKIVCFSDDDGAFAQRLAERRCWSSTSWRPEWHFYTAKNIDGSKSNKDGIIIVTKPPMIEVVKHPGVLIVFSVGNLGAGSAKLLDKWRVVCHNAQKWGGKVLLLIPFDCDAWHRNFVFAKFCVDFGLGPGKQEGMNICFR